MTSGSAAKTFRSSLGVMQGRLSPTQFGRIQSFPWGKWKAEFQQCSELQIELLEWTIDSYRIDENPIFLPKGIKEIKSLMETFGVRIESVTCDFFMENAPWAAESNVGFLKSFFSKLSNAANELEISLKFVVPLVDSGSLRHDSEFDLVLESLNLESVLNSNCSILFETDYPPVKFRKLLNSVSINILGVNLDTGNSASLGIDPIDEVQTFNSLIKNVHIKDRLLNGGSVPLGSGSTKFREYLKSLKRIGYENNFIFQTARSKDQDHVGEIKRSINYIINVFEELDLEA